MMTDMDHFMALVLELIPNASFGDDNDGQVIIYTDKKLEKDGSLTEMSQ